VVGVAWIDDDPEAGLLVRLALPARHAPRCAGCGRVTRAVYDHRERRWRHLDVGRTRLVVSCRLARVRCGARGVREQQVPWARAGARFTRALEDTCAWLARGAPARVVAALLRVDWETVGASPGAWWPRPARAQTAWTGCAGSAWTRSRGSGATTT
jgi:transposase